MLPICLSNSNNDAKKIECSCNLLSNALKWKQMWKTPNEKNRFVWIHLFYKLGIFACLQTFLRGCGNTHDEPLKQLPCSVGYRWLCHKKPRGSFWPGFISRVNLQNALLPPALPSGVLWLRGSWSRACVKYTVNMLNRNSLDTAKWQAGVPLGGGMFSKHHRKLVPFVRLKPPSVC